MAAAAVADAQVAVVPVAAAEASAVAAVAVAVTQRAHSVAAVHVVVVTVSRSAQSARRWSSKAHQLLAAWLFHVAMEKPWCVCAAVQLWRTSLSASRQIQRHS